MRKDDTDKYHGRVNVYETTAMLSAIAEAAKSQGLSVPGWIRQAARFKLADDERQRRKRQA